MVLIASKKGLEERELVAVLHQVEDGFTHGHSVKEHNALFDEYGRCILCNLGVDLVIVDEERL